MLISAAITYVRQELNDSLSSRWTSDSQILRFVARAIDRAQHVIRKSAPQLASKSTTLTFYSGIATADIPDDFLAPISMTRSDGKQMRHVPEQDWDRLDASLDECSCWHIVDNESIEVHSSPTSDREATLRYFYDVTPYSLTTSDSMPWGGRFDGPIMDYAANRARNVDEMNIQADEVLLRELETRILDTLMLWSPGVVDSDGWNAGSY